MATVSGLTAARMQEIIDATIVDADIIADHLILTKEDGSTIDAGALPAAEGGGIDKVTAFPTVPAPEDGDMIIRIDLPGDPIYKFTDGAWELQPRMGALTIPTVRARRSANTAALATASIVPWDAEDWDTDTLHDNATNPERITVKTPGRYAVQSSVILQSDATGAYRAAYIEHRSSAGTLLGTSAVQSPPVNGARTRLNVSATFNASAGDYFQVRIEHNATSSLTVDYVSATDFSHISATWLSGAGQTVDERGAPAVEVYPSTGANILSGNAIKIPFDSETFDTDGMHDNVVNPTRITIKTPGLYEVKAVVQFSANATGRRSLGIFKNGAAVSWTNQPAGVNSTHAHQIVKTLLLAAGDYLEIEAYQDSGSTLTYVAGSANTSFSATLVGTGKTVTPHCRVGRTANWALPATSTWQTVPWDLEEADNDNMHSTSSATENIVIRTAGVYSIDAFLVGGGVFDGTQGARIQKNGASISVDERRTPSAVTEWPHINISAVVECAVGDIITIQYWSSSNTPVHSNSRASVTKINAPSGPSSGIEVVEGWKFVGPGASDAAPFQNSWTDNNATTWGRARFRKDRGKVTLEGMVANGSAAGAVIFTLPVGYRPASRSRFAVYHGSPSGVAYLEVNTDGTVYFGGVSAVSSGSLSGASFYVD